MKFGLVEKEIKEKETSTLCNMKPKHKYKHSGSVLNPLILLKLKFF